jgi:hypothetical protein
MDIEGTAAEAVDQKQAFWTRALEEWRNSGLSGTEFQRQNNLTKNAFVYWKRKLMPRSEKTQTLVPVSIRKPSRLPTGASTSCIRLHVGGLYTVEVSTGFDAQTLREVLAVVRDCSG